MSETTLPKLVRQYLADTRELGLRLPTEGDKLDKLPLPSKTPILAYGADRGTVSFGKSKLLGSPSFTIRLGRIIHHIARISPYHPEIPPEAAIYQMSPDGTMVAISAGRTQANRLDRLSIRFATLAHTDGATRTDTGAHVDLDFNGNIIESSLPAGMHKATIKKQMRTVLEAIRDGKPVTTIPWVKKYARRAPNPSFS